MKIKAKLNGGKESLCIVILSASIGVSLFPTDGRESQTLLKHADAAMYEAKKSGRNQFHFFTLEMNLEIERHVAIASGLRYAMERNEFRLVYQPQVELDSGRIVSFEALLRWDHPDNVACSPDEFIPIDIIKIDQSFVRDAPSDQDDGSIVRAIVAMATSLGINVIAEGVETEAQSRFVTQAGCDIAQGYYFHAPMYAQEITRLLAVNASH